MDQSKSIKISSDWYNLDDLFKAYQEGAHLELSAESKDAIKTCQTYLLNKLDEEDVALYGINTGFGSLCDVRIGKDDLEELQYNLLRSHACGTGEAIPEEVVRLILILKVMSLSQGHSGVSLDLVEKLVSLYNEEQIPVLYEYGSLGASGDLAPLAHLSLPLIGEGEVWKNGQVVPSQEAGVTPIRLGPKAGLALINGTQFSTAFTYWSTMTSQRLLDWSVAITALSCDVFGCLRMPFDHRIHDVRKQKGQLQVASSILGWLEGSPLEELSGMAVQDPYAFRCSPQVLGATMDTLDHVRSVVEREINAVTDNPNIFSETDGILTGGNFHAQPIALVADFLAIAMAELANISERRLYQLIGGGRGLPSYLTKNPGSQSGFMIVQYSAASVVSHNKQLCTPASVDSIVSSQGQEDHVSMAANASTKLYKVVKNVERVLAMELLTAVQALDFRRPARTSPKLEKIVSAFRASVPFLDSDREMYKDMRSAVDFIQKEVGTYL